MCGTLRNGSIPKFGGQTKRFLQKSLALFLKIVYSTFSMPSFYIFYNNSAVMTIWSHLKIVCHNKSEVHVQWLAFYRAFASNSWQTLLSRLKKICMMKRNCHCLVYFSSMKLQILMCLICNKKWNVNKKNNEYIDKLVQNCYSVESVDKTWLKVF